MHSAERHRTYIFWCQASSRLLPRSFVSKTSESIAADLLESVPNDWLLETVR